MPAASPSLRWLYLAVLGPLILLAGLAWWGTQSQLKAAWTEAREQAQHITNSSATRIAASLEAYVVTIPDYPDPPVPGTPSENDLVLDTSDIPSLLELRDDPDGGISPAGLPRNALAALRLHAIDPELQKPEELAELLTNRFPSVLTASAITRFNLPGPSAISWTRAEEARHLIRLFPDQAADGFWWRDGRFLWWVQSSEGAIRYILPDQTFAAFNQLPETLPDWAVAVVQEPLTPSSSDLPGTKLATASVPFKSGVSISLFALPSIIEQNIRKQQHWTFALLAAALLTATLSLFAIHRTVARERHLADLKSQFVASVSHELRAPLGSIRLMAEALQQEKVSKPAEFHTLIAKEGARLSHLIENVLDFARIEEGRKHYHFEECDLTALLRDTLRLMQPIAEEREVHLTFDLAEITLTVDPAAIQQALVNLLDNAIKFSPPKGIVKLEVIELLNQSVAITITDHGPGIPAKEHKNIFKRFHRLGNELRRETQGTGIGLSIVEHIAEAHGGTITVASTPPKGSTFTLSLPENPCVS